MEEERKSDGQAEHGTEQQGETLVDGFLKNQDKDSAKAREEYSKYLGKSRVEDFGEEDLVIKEMFLGKKPSYIVKTLNLKYPDAGFIEKDIDHFLIRHKEIMQYFRNKNNATAKRHLAARTEVEEELANIALFTRNLITKYDKNNDSSATLGAIKALNTTIMNYSKITGFLEPHEEKKTENLITVVSDRNKSLAEKLLKADFKMIDAQVINNEELKIEEKKDGSTGTENNKADSK